MLPNGWSEKHRDGERERKRVWRENLYNLIKLTAVSVVPWSLMGL